jgi:hypothetical protein
VVAEACADELVGEVAADEFVADEFFAEEFVAEEFVAGLAEVAFAADSGGHGEAAAEFEEEAGGGEGIPDGFAKKRLLVPASE